MIYKRRFTLNSSRFNSNSVHNDLYDTLDARRSVSMDFVLELLEQVHGHTFTVDVECEGFTPVSTLLDDSYLCELVGRWNNTNLSVHADFLDSRYQPTVERMAQLLAIKVGKLGKHLLSVKVTVADVQSSAIATWHGESQAVS